MDNKKWMELKTSSSRFCMRGVLDCLCSGNQLKTDDTNQPSKPLTTADISSGHFSSLTDPVPQRTDTGNHEEVDEYSLHVGGCLNYEEARALLGRMEYNNGNIEAALRVFDGLDIGSVVTKIKFSISRRTKFQNLRSHSSSSVMSAHAVCLLLEAIFLKAKSLAHLGRYKEAAQSCSIVLDTVESALPEGLPGNFGIECKFQETLSRAVELLPELWKLSGFFQEAIASYRRGILMSWNLGAGTLAKIQKEFAIFLLYGGYDASPPSLGSQMDCSFVPRNNIEEAVLLLMILLRKYNLGMVKWDLSIYDHLAFALSVSGEFVSLAKQVETLPPDVLERVDGYYTLALCYMGEGNDMVALNLLKNILVDKDDPSCVKALLLASKICGKNNDHANDGVAFSHRALDQLDRGCDQIESVANLLLGISLSTQSRSSFSDSERVARQHEALEVFDKSKQTMKNVDYRIIYNLSLENAEQRKLDVALGYAKALIRLEAGSNAKTWILLVRILSAQKRFVDAEIVVNAALDQTGKWSQTSLLCTKARVQVAQGMVKNAIETYSHVLSILQLRRRNVDSGMTVFKDGERDRKLELEIWYDLTHVYMSMKLLSDAEVCISKIKALGPFSASFWHATGQLHEAKGLKKEALAAYKNALDIEPAHVPSLVSTATVLRQLGTQSVGAIRSYLTDAIRFDRSNYFAWFHLGLLYASDSTRLIEAADCFKASALLEESSPVESFR